MTAEEELKDLALEADLPELLEVVVWKGEAMTPLERAAKACDEWEQEPPVPGRLLKARLHELIALAIREAVSAEREACAALAEEKSFWPMTKIDSAGVMQDIAEAIRARGQS